MNGSRSEGWGFVGLVIALKLLCCGIPLLLLSGVSLAFLISRWSLIGAVLAALGVAAFMWYRKRNLTACPVREDCCGLIEQKKDIAPSSAEQKLV